MTHVVARSFRILPDMKHDGPPRVPGAELADRRLAQRLARLIEAKFWRGLQRAARQEEYEQDAAMQSRYQLQP